MAKDKKPMEPKDCTSCEATAEMLTKSRADGVETVWERYQKQQPQCKFGMDGICCKNCSMGPCRVRPGKPGICGATASTVSARNFARMVAGGAAAHSDHGRGVAEVFLAAAKGEAPGYGIQDEHKLIRTAQRLGIETEGKAVKDVAIAVGEKALSEFGNQEGELQFPLRAPDKRVALWRELGVLPRGVDREIVEIMHRTHIGVDMEYKNIMRQATRAAIGDGWGGSMIATELQDILFHTPIPLRAKVNLGTLKKDEVNLIVHGHEPLLSEMIVLATRDEEMLKLAKEKGAKGINIAGICCTANEILMRHGIPIAGNFLQQEVAMSTGAVDAMVVDVQCIMQSLPEVASHYHTKVITTADKANIPGSDRILFNEHDALNSAKKIVRAAVENFSNRGPVDIPDHVSDLIGGFSHETIEYMLGGRFRTSYRPLNDNIINGRILGVAGVVGCNNVKVKHDWLHSELVKELIANNVLVVQTGCSAIACAKFDFMRPEAAMEYAGQGLREVCQTVGIPPVLHSGSCVDNSRILIAAAEIVKEGGLGEDISDVPAVGVGPEWMSEKAVSIGHYFVSSGVDTFFAGPPLFPGDETFHEYITGGIEEDLKAKWGFEQDPGKLATLCIDHMKGKRKALGIEEQRERILYDMAMRRELEV